MVRLFSWLRPDPARRLASQYYVTLVGQARKPYFYEALGVPDSLDGRFEMIALHMFVMLERLRAAGEEESALLRQRLIEFMLDDMDRSLREMGVGDTGVGKRVKTMADALNGRLQAYKQSFAESSAFVDALRRNVYGTVTIDDAFIQKLAAYTRAAVGVLQQQSDESVLAGEVSFEGAITGQKVAA